MIEVSGAKEDKRYDGNTLSVDITNPERSSSE